MPFEAEGKGSQGNKLWKGEELGMVAHSCDPKRGQRQDVAAHLGGHLALYHNKLQADYGYEPDPTTNKKREMELVVSGSKLFVKERRDAY